MKPRTYKQYHVYIALAIIGIALAGASTVLADDSTDDNTSRDEARAQLEEQREAQKQEMEANREAQKQEWEARKAEIEANREAQKVEFEAKREEMKTEWEARKVEIEARREEHKAALSAERQERFNKIADGATERLTEVIAKMQGFIERLETRAGELAARGVDTSATLALLEQAKTVLDEASVAAGNMDVNIEYVSGSEEPQTAWDEVRADFTEVRDLLKQARELLREAVAALKDAVAAANLGQGVSDAVRQDDNSSDAGQPEDESGDDSAI